MTKDRKKLLERLEGLRVTDVVDGLDGVGLIDICEDPAAACYAALS